MRKKQHNTSVLCTRDTSGQSAARVPPGLAERPTYFPMRCCGKRSADHQSWELSFSSCGCIRSCDTASDVKGEEKAAFSARHKHRDIIRPLILISSQKYSHIQATDSVPPSLYLLSGFLTLLRNRVCISLPHSHLRQGTFNAVCL